jgi:hypothetical protein
MSFNSVLNTFRNGKLLTISQNDEESKVFYWRSLVLNNWWISPLTIHRFYASLAVGQQNTYDENKYS